MEKNRCQVCEGPIVNGRCRLCGMPYRNDDTLYHLNENRSDHYQHATNRARAMMRQEEVPLGDRLEGKNGSIGSKKSGSGNQPGQVAGKTATYKRDFNKGKKGNRIAILIFLFFLLCAGVSVIQKGMNDGFGTGFVNESGETLNNADFQIYALYPEETLEVGVDIPEGHYFASSEEDTIQFLIKGSGFEMGIIEVSQEAPQKITLTEGDRIRILQAESGDSRVVLSKIEE